jgi:hypothetical protein
MIVFHRPWRQNLLHDIMVLVDQSEQGIRNRLSLLDTEKCCFIKYGDNFTGKKKMAKDNPTFPEFGSARFISLH